MNYEEEIERLISLKRWDLQHRDEYLAKKEDERKEERRIRGHERTSSATYTPLNMSPTQMAEHNRDLIIEANKKQLEEQAELQFEREARNKDEAYLNSKIKEIDDRINGLKNEANRANEENRRNIENQRNKEREESQFRQQEIQRLRLKDKEEQKEKVNRKENQKNAVNKNVFDFKIKYDDIINRISPGIDRYINLLILKDHFKLSVDDVTELTDKEYVYKLLDSFNKNISVQKSSFSDEDLGILTKFLSVNYKMIKANDKLKILQKDYNKILQDKANIVNESNKDKWEITKSYDEKIKNESSDTGCMWGCMSIVMILSFIFFIVTYNNSIILPIILLATLGLLIYLTVILFSVEKKEIQHYLGCILLPICSLISLFYFIAIIKKIMLWPSFWLTIFIISPLIIRAVSKDSRNDNIKEFEKERNLKIEKIEKKNDYSLLEENLTPIKERIDQVQANIKVNKKDINDMISQYKLLNHFYVDFISDLVAKYHVKD